MRYDFDRWPRDTNELMCRLFGWWSRSQWLLRNTNQATVVLNAGQATVVLNTEQAWKLSVKPGAVVSHVGSLPTDRPWQIVNVTVKDGVVTLFVE